MKKKALQTGFGGVYDKGENLFAAQWSMDSNVRKKNIYQIYLFFDELDIKSMLTF